MLTPRSRDTTGLLTIEEMESKTKIMGPYYKVHKLKTVGSQ
jgi:hypothetical protein